LKRDGGWPTGSSVAVAKKFTGTPVPTGGQGWGALYSVDLTAQPSQSLPSAGSYTIDGKTWWVKGGLGTGNVNTLVNGTGLRLVQPDTIDVSTRAWWGTNGLNAYTARVNVFPLAQLAGYNPSAPLAVTWRATGPADGGNGRCSVMALCDVTLNASNLTGAEKATALTLNHFDLATYGQWDASPYDNFSASPLGSSYNGTVLGDYESGIYRFMPGRYWPLVKHWTGTISNPDTMLNAQPSGSNQVYRANTAVSNTPCLLFALQKPSSGAGTALDVALTHLTIWQPKVTP
jgi:hypothetical protein